MWNRELPLSDRGIQALPVTSLNGVVVADVLLLVLLDSGGCDSGQFFGRKQLSGHFTNTSINQEDFMAEDLAT